MDEFVYYYVASMQVGTERRVIYCEHGNQLDPANTVEDYHDRLDTPLGHHVVMDSTCKPGRCAWNFGSSPNPRGKA